MQRLDPSTSLLFIVDVQARLARAMATGAMERMLPNVLVLLEAASLLRVPVLATEHYSKGLGPTVDAIGDRLKVGGIEPVEKITFDACSEQRVAQLLVEHAPEAVVLAGLEAHICVFQTARELLRRGIAVCVVADAVASRTDENRALGLRLCERAGALLAPTESVVFDWLGRADTPEFKAIAKLLKPV
jgi:nicotinamidase-related amidase